MKKTLTIVLSMVLVAALTIAGTVAYLTDTDSKVNVMTVGSVEIEQIEQERDENGNLVDFTQAKPALPAVYTTEAWANEGVEVNGVKYKVFSEDMKNVLDKIVTVNNTGKSDAYVRTIVAIEAPDGDPNNLIHLNYNGTDVDSLDGFMVEIDGVDYYIVNFTYKEALAAGKKSAPSLMQLFLDKKTTNEDCAKFGDTWDILVLSQAVQAAGFENAQTALDEAFGKVADNAAAWFEGFIIPAYVSNAEDAAKAIASGGIVNLKEDVSGSDYFIGEDTTVSIKLNENKLSGTVSNNGNLSVNSGTIEQNGANALYNEGNAELTNVTLNMTNSTGYITNSRTEGSITIFENVDATSTGGGVNVWEGEAVFKSGSITTNSTSTSARHVFYVASGAKLTIENGTFTFSPTNLTRKGSYICAEQNATVIVNGGTFAKPSTRTAPIQALSGSTVIIYGGTFQFDPSAFVAEGYEAVQGTNGWWTVSAVANS